MNVTKKIILVSLSSCIVICTEPPIDLNNSFHFSFDPQPLESLFPDLPGGITFQTASSQPPSHPSATAQTAILVQASGAAAAVPAVQPSPPALVPIVTANAVDRQLLIARAALVSQVQLAATLATLSGHTVASDPAATAALPASLSAAASGPQSFSAAPAQSRKEDEESSYGKWKRPKKSILCTWPNCGKTIAGASLKRHMYTHTGERPYACTYEHCTNPNFADKSNCTKHFASHVKKQLIDCQTCKSFHLERVKTINGSKDIPKELWKHIRSQHVIDKDK